jgi:hypothetical protein
VEASVSTVDLRSPVDLRFLGQVIGRRGPELVDDMMHMLLAQIAELRGDEQVVGRLRASIESNLSAIQYLLEHPVDVRLVDPPAGALQWALQLAQRGIPLSVLWRAYHLCTARALLFCIEELTRGSDSVGELGQRIAAASALVNDYVDHVCERVGASYDLERQRWLRQQDAVRADRIADLLARPTDGIVEVAGPRAERLDALARDWLRARRSKRPVWPIRIPGRFGRELRAGALTTAAQPTGVRTWRDYLAAKY